MNYRDLILEKLLKKQNVFLTGGAGVGKTTTTREIIKAYEAEAKKSCQTCFNRHGGNADKRADTAQLF